MGAPGRRVVEGGTGLLHVVAGGPALGGGPVAPRGARPDGLLGQPVSGKQHACVARRLGQPFLDQLDRGADEARFGRIALDRRGWSVEVSRFLPSLEPLCLSGRIG